MTQHDPRAAARAREFDPFSATAQRAPAHAAAQGHDRHPRGPGLRRPPAHGAVAIEQGPAVQAPDQRLLDLRAAARARGVRATLAAVPLHRARLLRAMVAGRRAA
ncbi:hypothetical protein KZ813_10280 [Sphingomonas sp. RHCKR7]|uniref:hypothetical protein n=1 Tax=Sphingomonas folli TaxID=2862497 RepID=UPI001CA5D892|nr:hypothetical protein [Sphingomonas folli]MBW6527226.1 hypothetical protein [Sphingomonas folli]